MKKLFAILSVTLLINSCARKDDTVTPPQYDALSRKEMDGFIKDKGVQNFRWTMASDEMLMSALQQTDKVAAIGYRPADETNVEDRLADINIAEAKWRSAREQILAIVFEEEQKLDKSLNRNVLEVFGEEKVLPVVDVMIQNINTIKRLRASGLVRYVEPLAYQPDMSEGVNLRSGSGCGGYDGNASLTALIPAIFGVLLIVFGALARSMENLRKQIGRAHV